MKKARIIDNHAVDVVDTAESGFDVDELYHPDLAAQFVEVPQEVENGWILQDGIWSASPLPSGPVDLPSPAPVRKLTKLEYMNRFTDAELAVIYAAAKTVVQVEIWLEKFRLATDVDLEDPRTVAGVEAMEGAGLLAEGRAAEILA